MLILYKASILALARLSRPVWACEFKSLIPIILTSDLLSRPVWACEFKSPIGVDVSKFSHHAPCGRVNLNKLNVLFK